MQYIHILGTVVELDALGDDMLLDEDTSYLDSATIPDPPNTVPQTTGGQTNVSSSYSILCSTANVVFIVYRMVCCWMSLVYLKCLIHEKCLYYSSNVFV